MKTSTPKKTTKGADKQKPGAATPKGLNTSSTSTRNVGPKKVGKTQSDMEDQPQTYPNKGQKTKDSEGRNTTDRMK